MSSDQMQPVSFVVQGLVCVERKLLGGGDFTHEAGEHVMMKFQFCGSGQRNSSFRDKLSSFFEGSSKNQTSQESSGYTQIRRISEGVFKYIDDSDQKEYSAEPEVSLFERDHEKVKEYFKMPESPTDKSFRPYNYQQYPEPRKKKKK
ncbi:hypothetical protein NPIL_58181 [Nephila pilipes]|uniref:Uncharacterized protein n=1 Tax=Nephila pilipes TaxID=299642 RepID=A0A8X6NKT0_NEPPI|nr:hypothetical protein NPIL_58181 [Nephila pilipes]